MSGCSYITSASLQLISELFTKEGTENFSSGDRISRMGLYDIDRVFDAKASYWGGMYLHRR